MMLFKREEVGERELISKYPFSYFLIFSMRLLPENLRVRGYESSPNIMEQSTGI